MYQVSVLLKTYDLQYLQDLNTGNVHNFPITMDTLMVHFPW